MSTKFNDPSLDKALKTTEEFDCERRGYKLTKTCLGAGAYAKVKLAYVSNVKMEKDKRLSDELKEKGTNKVAIKVISRKSAPKEYINKFMPREIETLHATYRFPNIVQLYETFRTDTRVYLVMEYASKGDLLEYINLRSGKTPGVGEVKAKYFFKQLVAGLQHCHRRNVVHRDLKCENLLIDDDEVLKISDFGFATRFPTNKQKLLETFCGSYAYAAPEILQAEKYDGKIADIWSLGVILFAMLNGRLPYNDRDIRTLIEQTKAKPRFSSRVQVTAECQDLVCKILTTDPIKRASIQEILRHPCLASDNSSNDKLSRGVPDGKSDEIVANESVNDTDCPKYNFQNNKKFAYQPYTQRVLKRERWMSKGPEPQAIQKLLHSRTTKLTTEDTSLKEAADKTEQVTAKKKTVSPKMLSKYLEERNQSSDSKGLVTGILPNKYQTKPVKKIAFGSNNGSPKPTSSYGTTYRLALCKRPKNPPVIPVMLSDKSKDCFLPASKQSRKNNACILPVVCASTKTTGGKSKSNSAPTKCQKPQHSPDNLRQARKNTRPAGRQTSAQIPKQYKTKAIQNFTFNQPGINIEVVSLRRNWQKLKQTAAVVTQASKEDDVKGKNGKNNIELTYFTLSGKEVNVRMRDENQRALSISNVYGR